jgi:2-iminoacetate synthase
MSAVLPEWLDPGPWLEAARSAGERDVSAALAADSPGVAEFAALISPRAGARLEAMARKAQALTRAHFGNTIGLYAPLYLSNICPGGCAYCGFASDRAQERHRLEGDEIVSELDAMRAMGFEDVLLLTGERCPAADFEYLRRAVELAATRVHGVSVESFAMSEGEYAALERAGCTGVTLYQETYDPERYDALHRWGPKRDFLDRLDAPARAMRAGVRVTGLGALLGLADPLHDMIALYRHADRLRRLHWRAGVMLSFPRLCHERGDFAAPFPVDDRQLAQFIMACRVCMPDVPLVLSTRERPRFRDGMAGVGVSRMSVASRTTVGGYGGAARGGGQFDVSDTRGIDEFSAALRRKGLDPVFKNWDRALHDVPAIRILASHPAVGTDPAPPEFQKE